MTRRMPAAAFERAVRADLHRRRWLRLHAALIGTLCLLAGWGLSHMLMNAGMHQLGLRYVLALLGGYAIYLLLLNLWCRWLLSRQEGSLDGLDVPAEWPRAPEADWHAASSAKEAAGSALEALGAADEGIVVAIPLALAIGAAVLIGAALGFAVFGLFGIEVLLGVAVEIAFASAGTVLAYKAQREGWLTHALRRTLKPFLACLLLMALLGAALDHWAPQARSLPHALQLWRG